MLCMSTAPDPDSSYELHIATIVAKYGFAVVPVGYGVCSVPGCCGPRLRRPWTYTVGLVDRGQPELMLFGLYMESAHHGINALAAEMQAGRQVANDEPFMLDGVGVKVVDVPPQWLMLDRDRMGMWFNHYGGPPDPAVRQLVWPDQDGLFPDDPSCDPRVRRAQPILRDDPRSFPKPYTAYRKSRARSHGGRRR
jgi:hypothetical protein